jgi:hypothetical protein
VSVLGLVLVALAAYRLACLVAVDSISVPLRDRLYTFAWDESETEIDPNDHTKLRARRRGPVRAWLYELVSCPYCLSVWFAAGLYAAWRWLDSTAIHVVIAMLAVAGAAALMVSFDQRGD